MTGATVSLGLEDNGDDDDDDDDDDYDAGDDDYDGDNGGNDYVCWGPSMPTHRMQFLVRFWYA